MVKQKFFLIKINQISTKKKIFFEGRIYKLSVKKKL